ncbi:winged helix-turn-helix transcriptional regulator [Phytoactinopolyspora alkaliphila]|uniref:Winged helix-turn-helix transcriptional regulator n=2 Tax=Phytoactinopolyspora alkaliphila TaxID=1783498 RepID=A0A6N9YJJ0_9ACTN|nr:winged helix-turn-helix transcriptional regulator [Phytoactinopolyspora alkaliphila]
MKPFDPDAKDGAYQYMRLAEYLAECIKTEAIRPKSMLTPQRTLARQYGVSLETVRRAVAELERRGLIKTLPAKGMFVL